MSLFILSVRLTAPLAENSAITTPTNLGNHYEPRLYDHEGWYGMKKFVKLVKAISTPQDVLKTPNRRLLELEDQIDFLLKGSRPAPAPIPIHTPQAHVNVVYPNSRPQNQNEPPTLSTFAFRKRISPSPQPQALNNTFKARVWDYMAAHTERMERFENTIFKQRKEINGRTIEMFGLLKELTASKTPKKVLIREEAKFHVTKNLNSISLTKEEEGGSNRTKAKSIKISENDEAVEAPGSQPVAYYLKHKINEELIKGLANNSRFNNSQSRTQAGKKKGKEYKVLLGGPAYDVILKKRITKKEDIGGNFEIPCSIGNLKRVSALINQGFDVNVMPYYTYMKLTDERPAQTDIRLSLASHSYIYPFGIAEDVLVEVVEHVYPVDFVILNIKENENSPFILGTPFLTTAKASIKFDTGTITLRTGKHKVSFHRIPDSSNITNKGVRNNIGPICQT
ncbi:MAK10-like protein [Tanacetum coccineum]